MKITSTDVERFYSFVKRGATEDSCWLWVGGKRSHDGRGRFWIDGETRYAPVVSFRIHKGQIPEGTVVRHVCDVPNCVNPKHLELGTLSDNSKDVVARNRRSFVGNNAIAAKLDTDSVSEIRNKIKMGYKQKELAEEYGVHPATISYVARNKTWVNFDG